MGSCICIYIRRTPPIPKRLIILDLNHSNQLSLAIHPRVLAMSTTKIGGYTRTIPDSIRQTVSSQRASEVVISAAIFGASAL